MLILFLVFLAFFVFGFLVARWLGRIEEDATVARLGIKPLPGDE